MKKFAVIAATLITFGCATQPDGQPDCYQDIASINRDVSKELEIVACGNDVQLIKTELCVTGSVPVEATVIPLIGAIAYNASVKQYSLQITARIGNKIVGSKVTQTTPSEHNTLPKQAAQKAALGFACDKR